MELPSDDDGEPLVAASLDKDGDDGESLELPDDDDWGDALQRASGSGQGPLKHKRSSSKQPRGLQPGPIPAPVVVDGIEPPDEVITGELHDILWEVSTSSPKKGHREVARLLRKKESEALQCVSRPRLFRGHGKPGSTHSHCACGAEPGRCLGWHLARPRHGSVFASAHRTPHAEAGLARWCVRRLGDRLGLVAGKPPGELARRDSPAGALCRVLGTPLH